MIPLRYPKLILIIAFIVFAISAAGIFKLRINTDGHTLVPHHTPEISTDRKIKEQFNIQDKVMVVIESNHEEGIFNDGTIDLLMELSNRLRSIEGVDPWSVLSLSTLMQRPKRIHPERYPHLIDYNPVNDDISKLKNELREIDFLRGILISTDGDKIGLQDWTPSATAIHVGFKDRGEAPAVISRIKESIDGSGSNRSDDVYITGSTVAEAALGIHILKDLAFLIPFSILAMAIIFWLRYRSFYGILLPLTEVLACLVFVFGLMGYTGVPLYLTITIMPVILTAIGISDEIHILNCYSFLLNNKEPDVKQTDYIKATMHIMTRRIVLTSLTTAIGFSAFLFSPVEPVRYFGLFTATGILFCMCWTLIVIPAALTIIPVAEFKKNAVISPLKWGKKISRLSIRAIKHKKLIFGLSILFIAGASVMLGKVKVWDSWRSGFAKKNEVRVNMERANALFYGINRLLISFNPGDLLSQPETINKLKSLEDFLSNLTDIQEGGVFQITSQLEYLNQKLDQGSISENSYGENRFLLDYYHAVFGPVMLKEQIDLSNNVTLTHLFLKDPNYEMVANMLESIMQFKQKTWGDQVSLSFGGDVSVNQAMIKGIVETQMKSVFMSLICIFIISSIFFRSVKYSSLIVLPPLITITALFTVMGIFGIKLGVATSMFASIIIGIGVDFSIHLIESYRSRKNGKEQMQILSEALNETTPAFIMDTLVITVAFGLLIFSSIPSNASLGLFILTGYISCFLATIFLLPAILVGTGSKGEKKVQG